MPAKTEKQRRFIFFKRKKYKTETKTPKKWKWIWGPEWLEIKESRILSFGQFLKL